MADIQEDLTRASLEENLTSPNATENGTSFAPVTPFPTVENGGIATKKQESIAQPMEVQAKPVENENTFDIDAVQDESVSATTDYLEQNVVPEIVEENKRIELENDLKSFEEMGLTLQDKLDYLDADTEKDPKLEKLMQESIKRMTPHTAEDLNTMYERRQDLGVSEVDAEKALVLSKKMVSLDEMKSLFTGDSDYIFGRYNVPIELSNGSYGENEAKSIALTEFIMSGLNPKLEEFRKQGWQSVYENIENIMSSIYGADGNIDEYYAEVQHWLNPKMSGDKTLEWSILLNNSFSSYAHNKNIFNTSINGGTDEEIDNAIARGDQSDKYGMLTSPEAFGGKALDVTANSIMFMVQSALDYENLAPALTSATAVTAYTMTTTEVGSGGLLTPAEPFIGTGTFMTALFTGLSVTTSLSMGKQYYAESYAEMRQAGVTHASCKKLAPVVAMLMVGIEKISGINKLGVGDVMAKMEKDYGTKAILGMSKEQIINTARKIIKSDRGFMRGAMEYGKDVLKEGIEEPAQDLAQIGGRFLGMYLDGVDGEKGEWTKKDTERLEQSFIYAIASAGGMSGVGLSVRKSYDFMTGKTKKQNYIKLDTEFSARRAQEIKAIETKLENPTKTERVEEPVVIVDGKPQKLLPIIAGTDISDNVDYQKARIALEKTLGVNVSFQKWTEVMDKINVEAIRRSGLKNTSQMTLDELIEEVGRDVIFDKMKSGELGSKAKFNAETLNKENKEFINKVEEKDINKLRKIVAERRNKGIMPQNFISSYVDVMNEKVSLSNSIDLKASKANLDARMQVIKEKQLKGEKLDASEEFLVSINQTLENNSSDQAGQIATFLELYKQEEIARFNKSIENSSIEELQMIAGRTDTEDRTKLTNDIINNALRIAETDKVSNLVLKHLNANEDGNIVQTNYAKTLGDLVKDGTLTFDEAKQMLVDSGATIEEKHITETVLDAIAVNGLNKDGVIMLFKGNNPTTILEEMAEVAHKRMLEQNKEWDAKVTAERKSWETYVKGQAYSVFSRGRKRTALLDSLKRNKTQSNTEWLSDRAVEWSVGKLDTVKILGVDLKMFLRAIENAKNWLVGRGMVLKKYSDAGKMDSEIQNFLENFTKDYRKQTKTKSELSAQLNIGRKFDAVFNKEQYKETRKKFLKNRNPEITEQDADAQAEKDYTNYLEANLDSFKQAVTNVDKHKRRLLKIAKTKDIREFVQMEDTEMRETYSILKSQLAEAIDNQYLVSKKAEKEAFQKEIDQIKLKMDKVLTANMLHKTSFTESINTTFHKFADALQMDKNELKDNREEIRDIEKLEKEITDFAENFEENYIKRQQEAEDKVAKLEKEKEVKKEAIKEVVKTGKLSDDKRAQLKKEGFDMNALANLTNALNGDKTKISKAEHKEIVKQATNEVVEAHIKKIEDEQAKIVESTAKMNEDELIEFVQRIETEISLSSKKAQKSKAVKIRNTVKSITDAENVKESLLKAKRKTDDIAREQGVKVTDRVYGFDARSVNKITNAFSNLLQSFNETLEDSSNLQTDLNKLKIKVGLDESSKRVAVDSSKKLKKVEEKLKERREKVKDLENKYKNERGKVARREAKIAELEASGSVQNTEQHKAEIKKLQETMGAIIQEQANEIKEMNALLLEMKDAVSKSPNELIKKNAIDRINSIEKTNKETVAELESELEAQIEKNKLNDKVISSLSKKNEIIEEQIKVQENSIKGLEKDLARYEKELAREDKKNSKLEQKVAELKQGIKDIRESKNESRAKSEAKLKSRVRELKDVIRETKESKKQETRELKKKIRKQQTELSTSAREVNRLNERLDKTQAELNAKKLANLQSKQASAKFEKAWNKANKKNISLEAKILELLELTKEFMPRTKREKNKIDSYIKKLLKFKTESGINGAQSERVLADVKKTILDSIEIREREDLIKTINKILDKYETKSVGGISKGKLVVSMQRGIDAVREVWSMSPKKFKEEVAKAKAENDWNRVTFLYSFNTDSGTIGLSSAHLAEMLYKMEVGIEEALAEREIIEHTNNSIIKEEKNDWIGIIKGDGRDLNAFEKGINDMFMWFHNPRSLLEYFDNSEADLYESPVVKKILSVINDMSNKATKGLRVKNELVLEIIKRTIGDSADINKIGKTKIETGVIVNELDENFKPIGEMELKATPFQLISIRNWWRNDKSRKKLENMGYTQDSINKIEETLGGIESASDKGFVKLADALLAYYDENYKEMNEVHKYLYHADMIKEMGYSPMVSLFTKEVEKDMKLGDEHTLDGYVAKSILERNDERGVLDIENADAMNILGRSIMVNENWKAKAIGMRYVRSVLMSNEVSNLIIHKYGMKAYNRLEERLQSFEVNSVKNVERMEKLDKFVNRFVLAKLLGNVGAVTKQMSSAVGYMVEMPPSEWFKFNAKLLANPKLMNETWKEIMENSEMMKDRYKLVKMSDAFKNLENSQDFKSLAKQSKMDTAVAIGMAPTKLGDKLGIMGGGMAYYLRRKEIYLETMNEEVATARAITDFEIATSNLQQSGKAEHLGYFQHNRAFRMYNLFMNSQYSYMRVIVNSLTNLSKGKGNIKKNSNALAITAFILPVLFTGAHIANGLIFNELAKAFGYGDDDEEDMNDAMKILAMSPATSIGIPFFGDMVSYSAYKVFGLRPPPFLGQQKVFGSLNQNIDDVSSVGEALMNDDMFGALEHAMLATDGITPIPARRMRKYWKDFFGE